MRSTITRSYVYCPNCWRRCLGVTSGYICDTCNSRIHPGFIIVQIDLPNEKRKIRIARSYDMEKIQGKNVLDKEHELAERLKKKYITDNYQSKVK